MIFNDLGGNCFDDFWWLGGKLFWWLLMIGAGGGDCFDDFWWLGGKTYVYDDRYEKRALEVEGVPQSIAWEPFSKKGKAQIVFNNKCIVLPSNSFEVFGEILVRDKPSPIARRDSLLRENFALSAEETKGISPKKKLIMFCLPCLFPSFFLLTGLFFFPLFWLCFDPGFSF